MKKFTTLLLLLFTFSINTDIISQCSIDAVVADPGDCNGDDNFFVHINFVYDNVGDNGFTITGNGMNHGTFEYENLPVEIGPLSGDCETPWEFVVTDVDNNDCSDFTELGTICCGTTGECSITEVVADPGACNEDDNFFVHINFQYENVSELGFTVTGNGMDHGTFQYESLPVEIGPLSGDCETPWEFVITDVDNNDCSGFTELGTICCGTTGECSISDLILDVSDCNGDENFFVHINFEFSNVGDNGFSVLGNGMDHGDFEYTNLPIEIGPLSGDCETPWEFVVIDNDFEACSSAAELGEVCCGNSEECSITNVIADPDACNEEDEFFVLIDFEYANVGAEGFSVVGNGIDHGDFEYGDLPIEIGPLPGNCETPWEFVVIDNQFEDCSDFVDLGAICCGIECDITEINVETGDGCNEEGEYPVILDFEYQGTSNLGFDLWANGEYFGFYSYDELPLTINFPGSGDPFDEITVCDNDNLDCCASIVFASPCACLIDGVVAIPSDCNDDGQFNVTLNFEYNNTSEWFSVGGNGMNHGEYMYSELPVILGPFDGDGETEWEFVVVDSESELCFDFADLGTIDCGVQGECNIYDLLVEAYECDEDDMFLVDLDFEYANVGDHGFMVTVNEVEYGPFEYNDLYITLGPFDGDCETEYHFNVSDVDFPDCGDSQSLQPICCTGECNISEISVDPGECTGDGLFSIVLNFNYDNVNSELFDVYSGDDYVGSYAYADLPVSIEHFPERVNSDYDIITVCDSDSETCCATEEFMGPNCSEGGEGCEIGELNIDPGACNDDGFFNIHINFEYINVGDNGFTVNGNGMDYGTFQYADLPIELGPFEGDCETVLEFIVRDVDFEDCASDGFTESLCCGEQCDIRDIEVDPGECTGDGLFSIVLSFVYENVNSDLFDVYSGDDFVGTYAYADLPVTIEHFPERVNSDYDIITVCDSDSEVCCATLEFMGPNCSEGGEACEIGELNIEAGECNDDGFFVVHINFEYINVGENGFTVNGNGMDYGTFQYEDLPIELGPFEGDCETTLEFIVRDVDFEDCASDGFIEPVCCGEECDIRDIEVDPGECTGDGLFSIVLSFIYENVNSDLFDVYAGDDFVGTYAYADLPVTIEHFPERVNSDYDIITVCDSDSEVCCGSHEFMGPDCTEGGEDCDIGQLNIEAGECNDDGFFIVHLNFEYVNVGENGFTVNGNGMDYGTFQYENLPIELGPLEGDCETVWEFVVRDVDFEDCAEDGSIEPVCCGNECNISNIQVDPGECTGDGLFSIVLNFDYDNVNSDLFDVYSGDIYVGTYSYANLPVTIEQFPERVNSEYDIITVCDNDSETCCETIEFMGPDCSENNDCEIGNLNIDVGECNDDGFFVVHINFEYVNVGDNGFTVHGNGMDYGTFEYESLPIEIGPLEGDCETAYEFIVQDVDFEDCASDGGIEPVCCASESCMISDIEVDPVECTGDGFYSLVLNFQHINTSKGGFDVFSDGEFVGFYQYEDLPVLVENFPEREGSDFDLISVCDNDSDVCCSSLEFMGLNCTASNIEEQTLESAVINHNMMTRQLEISFSDNLESDIDARIIDINGKLIYSNTIKKGNRTQSYDMNGVPSGIYILVLNNKNHLVNFKFVSI